MSEQKTIETLTKQARVISEKIDRIRDEERRTEAAKSLGKCFRYRNCYSCPQTDADYWWLYRRVTRVDEHGWIRMFDFQTDKDGKTTVEYENLAISDGMLGEPITLKQFRHAWRIQARMLNRQAVESGAFVP